MNAFDQQLIRLAERELPPTTTPREVIEWLMKHSVTNNTAARRLVIKECVRERLKGGKIRCADAVCQVADLLGCSYSMVSNYFYKKN